MISKALLIFVLSMALYTNTLNNGFVYDDAFTVVGNNLIKSISNIPRLFNKDYFLLSGETTYRPVVTLSYFLDYAIFGLNAWGFHLTNALLHAINGCLLYFFLISLKGRCTREQGTWALMASLLFVSHPVLTEAVNAISFREDLLAFLFYMAAINLYIHLRSVSNTFRSLLYGGTCLLYLLALLSKEMAITFPLVVCLYEWIYGNKERGVAALFNLYNLGYVAITLCYLYIRFYLFYNEVDLVRPAWQLTERLQTLPWMLASYLKLTIFPFSLSADYAISPVKTATMFTLIAPAVIILSLLFLALSVIWKKKEIAFCILFFLITLLPVSNIIPIGNPFAERYLYLSAIGITSIIGLGIYEVGNAYKKQVFFALVIVSLFSVLTVKRNQVWHDELSLWTDTLRKAPNSPRAHYAMGTVYASKDRLDEAIQEYEESIRISPYFPEAFNALGLAYYKKGMKKEGEEAIIAASNVRGLINYYKKGLVEDATQHYKKALEIDPSHRDARYNLALLYHEQGRTEEAIKEYIISLQYRPDDFDTLNSLGLAFFQKGFFEKALALYRKALDIDPESVTPYNNIAMVYAVMGKKMEAEKWFKMAIEKDPNSAETYYNLGFLYQNNSKLDEAVKAYKKAISIRPDYEEAKDRLRELEER